MVNSSWSSGEANASGGRGHGPGDPGPSDELAEACGVFAVYGADLSVAQLTFLGLFALQHRGQEAAGMAVSDGENIIVVKDQGLVTSVFDERTIAGLTGSAAIGHCRYSTTGSSTWRNAQPAHRSVEPGASFDVGAEGDTDAGSDGGGNDQSESQVVSFALAHNGNLVNTSDLISQAGMLEGTATSDTDVVAELLAGAIRRHTIPPAETADTAEAAPAAEITGTGNDTGPGPADALEAALLEVLPLLEGAFTFVLMDEERIVGVRDPRGFRPLCLGRLGDGWVLASESPALDIVGADLVREIAPGEMVIIDADGVRSLYPFAREEVEPRLCLFEFVYFARPDTRLYGRNMHQARVRMGEQLAEQAPTPGADMVMGVPESGVPAAEGFARRSGVPLGQGLVKNRYIGRSFIAPTQKMRAEAVRMKLNPLRENIEGKSLAVVDDSIVRGTTQHQLVKMLREAGAREVHLRITSPPVRWPCFYGIDTGTTTQLIAHDMPVEDIRQYLDVDSLAYLELDRLLEATEARSEGFCDACFTGNYPVEVPVTIGRNPLETPS